MDLSGQFPDLLVVRAVVVIPVELLQLYTISVMFGVHSLARQVGVQLRGKYLDTIMG